MLLLLLFLLLVESSQVNEFHLYTIRRQVCYISNWLINESQNLLHFFSRFIPLLLIFRSHSCAYEWVGARCCRTIRATSCSQHIFVAYIQDWCAVCRVAILCWIVFSSMGSNYFYHSRVVLQNRFDYDGHLIVSFPIGIQILWAKCSDKWAPPYSNISVDSHRIATNPTEAVVAATTPLSTPSIAQLVIHALFRFLIVPFNFVCFVDSSHTFIPTHTRVLSAAQRDYVLYTLHWYIFYDWKQYPAEPTEWMSDDDGEGVQAYNMRARECVHS